MTRTVPEKDANGVTRPHPTLALVNQQRADGSPFLATTLHEDIVLPAGCSLHVRRIAGPGQSEWPERAEFALQIIPAPKNWPVTDKERKRAASLRLDGSAIRMGGDR